MARRARLPRAPGRRRADPRDLPRADTGAGRHRQALPVLAARVAAADLRCVRRQGRAGRLPARTKRAVRCREGNPPARPGSRRFAPAHGIGEGRRAFVRGRPGAAQPAPAAASRDRAEGGIGRSARRHRRRQAAPDRIASRAARTRTRARRTAVAGRRCRRFAPLHAGFAGRCAQARGRMRRRVHPSARSGPRRRDAGQAS